MNNLIKLAIDIVAHTVKCLFVAMSICSVAISCDSDDIETEAMYTFTGETVATFCKNSPELTMFYDMMNACDATSLLSV